MTEGIRSIGAEAVDVDPSLYSNEKKKKGETIASTPSGKSGMLDR